MKNSPSFVCRIICSALFIFTFLNSAFAQPDTKTKTSKDWVWADEGIYRKQLKNDGIPVAVIETLVAKRKELIFSGRKVVSLPAETHKLFGQNPVTQAVCSDMGGETGWGGWTARTTGTLAPPSGWSAPFSPPNAPRFNLTSGPGIDVCTPGPVPGSPTIPVVAPGFGNASIQIGELMMNGAFAEELTYPLTVGVNDTNFTFAYAVVIEDPSHSVIDQPFVSLCIYDSNGTPVDPTCACFTYTAGPSLPGFYQSACNINSVSYYKPWTLVGINLAPWIGQTLNVVITNVDCSLTGHFAHSYWDFSCGTLSSITQFCIGEDSVVVTAQSTGSGYSYSWSPGGQTTSSIIVNPQLVDTVTLLITPPSGCGFYQVFVLAPTIISPGFTSTINCNTVTFSDTSGITGGTISGWQWNFPGGSPSTFNGQNPGTITYPIGGGTYTVTLEITSQASCKDTSIGVPITILPPPVITANSVSICANMTDTICASGGMSYVWSPGGATTTCLPVSTSSASTYTVVGMDANGCSAFTTANVNTNAQPNITATGDSICSGGCAPISAGGGVSYSWTQTSPPSLSCINCQNPTACPPGATTYTVIGIDANGCTNTATAIVGIYQNPTVTTNSTASNCNPCTGTANVNVITGAFPYSFSWNNGQTTSQATGLCTATYTCVVTDGNGCTSSSSVLVPVTPNPLVTAGPASTICFGQTTTIISASSSPAAISYIWSPAAGLSCTTCQSTTANPTSTNTYFVTVTDVNGCTNTASVPIIVGAIPQLSAIASPTVCTGGTIQLNANVSNVPVSQLPVHWNWFPPNSPPLNSDTLEDPLITPNTTTNLYVVVTDAYGCKDTAYATVYVETIPSVSWTDWTPYITCDGYVVPFFANVSDSGNSAYWEFGDNLNYTDYQPPPGGMLWTSAPPPHVYNFGSTYNVVVVAINSICRDTIDTTFTVNDLGQYLNVLPANVFTPNGDGYNDCFHPAMDIQNVPNITTPDSLQAALAECIIMEVWDRWGIKMFESEGADKCWDGKRSVIGWDGKTKNGAPAKEGTYYYIAKFKDVVIRGFVELLR